MSLISDVMRAQSLRLLNLSPLMRGNFSVLLPQPLSPRTSPPGMQATIESLFEARFMRSLADVTANAGAVGAAAQALSPSSAAFAERTALTTNTEIAEVKATAGSGLGTVEVDVEQLAKNQVNQGAALDRKSTAIFESGRQFFDLSVEGKSRRLSVFVAPYDTSEATLKKMAKAIRNTGMNVEASVEVDATTNSAQLKIQANKTGTGSSFSLQDTLGTLVQRSGADSVFQKSQDAAFTLNGISQTAENNIFDIDSGRIQVSLKGKTGKATISVTQDSRAVTEALTHFVSSVNRLAQSLARASRTLNPAVAAIFNRQLSLVREPLSEIGVHVNMSVVLMDFTASEDALRIDNDALEKAIEGDPTRVQELLAGPGGLAARIGSVAQAVESSSALHLMAKPQFALAFFGGGAGRDAVTGVLFSSFV